MKKTLGSFPAATRHPPTHPPSTKCHRPNVIDQMSSNQGRVTGSTIGSARLGGAYDWQHFWQRPLGRGVRLAARLAAAVWEGRTIGSAFGYSNCNVLAKPKSLPMCLPNALPNALSGVRYTWLALFSDGCHKNIFPAARLIWLWVSISGLSASCLVSQMEPWITSGLNFNKQDKCSSIV